MLLLNYLAHRRNCKDKQASRDIAIATLPAAYHAPLTPSEADILNTPISITASSVRSGALKPIDILHAYGKRAIWAHQKTNSLTEILIPTAEENISSDVINLQGPLAGIPVRYVNRPAKSDAVIVGLLRRAGAVPFVKTNVPITLLAFESTNDVFGRTKNPHSPRYSPGGSTGGESALLALGGSRIGVGTDVAGSVRIPAAWSGIYALRCSTGRFPKAGCFSSMLGQEGVAAVYSPMAKTMPDLEVFMKAVVDMKPWEVDYTVHPIPWRESQLPEKPRWGVLRSDGVVPPTPAVERALDTAISALRVHGDEVIELSGHPSCYDALRLASRLLNSDAGETFSSHFTSAFESTDSGVAVLTRLFSLPRFVKSLYAFYLRLRGDHITAGLIDDLRTRSVADQWRLVYEREAIRSQWFEYLAEQKVDFIITPPHALPGLPAEGGTETIAACGYTFLWNLLDYTAGVLPVGRVDAALDDVKDLKKRKFGNRIVKKAWALYDARDMEGLPIAVQIVGKRLEEEKVLGGMNRLVEALGDEGFKAMAVEVD
ncbi:Similar to Fatty-acid amide hydrolase 1; acc. no. Q9TUI8 [Pyronema omphalodes CBS 100304]|uniref:Similar to Fatty-acid amide hydrolase 1 acc. no. Q9TUI8 n=1 Tax=Pyronema omphalodes (strain CBS 100304) TaxID=1076935 RepID=U4LIV2_PYROM|nr:Similar to Fatty-acid amide hydrolase 1; acc. no. Q9TUI8 [Pyronema omphalodes CBS 100304]